MYKVSKEYSSKRFRKRYGKHLINMKGLGTLRGQDDESSERPCTQIWLGLCVLIHLRQAKTQSSNFRSVIQRIEVTFPPEKLDLSNKVRIFAA